MVDFDYWIIDFLGVMHISKSRKRVKEIMRLEMVMRLVAHYEVIAAKFSKYDLIF